MKGYIILWVGFIQIITFIFFMKQTLPIISAMINFSWCTNIFILIIMKERIYSSALYKSCINNMEKYYKFSKRLVIGGSMVNYNWRFSFKQYIIKKLVKWGAKAFLLFNSYNGWYYNLHFFVEIKLLLLEKLSKSENLEFCYDDYGIKILASILYIDNYYREPNFLGC